MFPCIAFMYVTTFSIAFSRFLVILVIFQNGGFALVKPLEMISDFTASKQLPQHWTVMLLFANKHTCTLKEADLSQS